MTEKIFKVINIEKQQITSTAKGKAKKYFANLENVRTFASAFEKKALKKRIGPVVQFG